MLLSRWLTSFLGIGCSGPPPTRMRIHVECNHSETHQHSSVMVQGLEASFPGDMVQIEPTEDHSHDYVGMFHCCFCPPGQHSNTNSNNNDDWFNVTTWESELTHWVQDVWDKVEHCAIVIEPHDAITSSL